MGHSACCRHWMEPTKKIEFITSPIKLLASPTRGCTLADYETKTATEADMRGLGHVN